MPGKVFSQSCNNWLHLPSFESYVSVGDLDVPGTKVTVEAVFMRTTPYTGGQIWAGDLVSKHVHPTDANYLLRPNNAEITTSNGYFRTPDICEIELGKIYHAAMVYDGSTLKFYRNGFLMSSVPATGTMYQNDFETRIGLYDEIAHNTNLIGYINEVRIWNTARTQAQIRAHMNSPLPAPATQPGLQAYYTFDNLLNKQGNPSWNGILGGSATINNNIPNCSFVADSCATKPVNVVTPAFNIPDTVCVNTPVNIVNTTIGASNYYWNFCVADINKVPTGTNIGNINGLLSQPVYMDYVQYNGNYYGFLINHYPGSLIRLDFGNSLLNLPVATDLGNFGGIIPPGYGAEGIQIVQNEGSWYAIVVGGYTPSGSTPRIVKINFGVDLLNASPVATNWGNIGNMLQPLDLHVFKENNNWYGFSINAENNTITRFNFTNSFDNTPTAINFGGFGILDYPTGIYAINDNGFWRVFVTNNGSSGRLVRLDFGNSLLNTPTAVNLGSVGSTNGLRDLTIIKYCDQIIGFAVNATNNSLFRLNFATLGTVPSVSNMGNVGNLNVPHSISKLFRVNDDLYSFITNVGTNSITRLRFSGCTNANPANSISQNPAPIVYNLPGTYNINLSVDDGLPTQASLCKSVVVLPELEHKPIQNLVACNGSIKIGSSSNLGTYLWNTGATSDSITVNSNGIYWVETNRYGCTNRDSFNITVVPPFQVNLGADKSICQGGNLILDAGISGDSYAWNTGENAKTITVNTAGTYFVKVTRTTCQAVDTVKVNLLTTLNFDFSYKQDVCNPQTIQFNSIGGIPTNTYWDFGDGVMVTGDTKPSHTYTATGNYIVKYGFGNGICTDTISKTISVNIIRENLILTPDTTICSGSSTKLRTVPALSFCWSPTTYLDNPNSPNPTSSATQDITYYFTAQTTGANLIVNGNFSQGNTGFTSGYNYDAVNTTEGEYFVGPNPRAWNSNLSTCTDHTSGNGNMLLVNGSPVADVNVWRKTVNVVPNTNYAFSTWIQALWPPNPAQLQFSINGQTTGAMITASLPTCTWTQFYTTWNSGNSTTAVISIVNKNTLILGNDFALDDISFAEVFIKRDSVKIKVEKPVVTVTSDTTICAGKSVQLNASGAQTYTWTPAAGLSGTGIANPIASPGIATQYIVLGTTQNGCSAKDTMRVNLYPKSPTAVSPDTTICKNSQAQLSVTGGTSYSWSPATTLNNPLIANPVASPASDTKYYVNIRDEYSCEYEDSVIVSIKPDALFSVNGPQSICPSGSVQLNASGGDIYNWQPVAGLSALNIANPQASPSTTTDYAVTVTETTCNQSKTLTTRVTVMQLPDVIATKSNDIDCRNSQSQLNASGADQYAWLPDPSLSNAGVYNPLATPVSTTSYIVIGTAINGCQAKDTISVIVHPRPDIRVSADTTICKNSFAGLSVTGGVGYSWFPAATLSDPSIPNPLAAPTENTRYYVTVRDNVACEYLDSVTVSIRPDPVFSVSDVKVCTEDSVQLTASGGDIYSWTPAAGLNSSDISNPIALPGNTRDYSVTITELACNQSATLSASVSVLPVPVITAVKSNDIDCSNDKSQLTANGASQYTWFPSGTLSNAAIFNPIASPDITTEYIVRGTNLEGCEGFDTVVVKVENLNRSDYLVPNAFTPNNDGLNDCFKIKYWGIVSEFEFSIFNRWGERLFYSKDPERCWDGTYKGVLQDGGVYVYIIKAKTFCQPEVFRKGSLVLVR